MCTVILYVHHDQIMTNCGSNNWASDAVEIKVYFNFHTPLKLHHVTPCQLPQNVLVTTDLLPHNRVKRSPHHSKYHAIPHAHQQTWHFCFLKIGQTTCSQITTLIQDIHTRWHSFPPSFPENRQLPAHSPHTHPQTNYPASNNIFFQTRASEIQGNP